jgi:hypothetical protein
VTLLFLILVMFIVISVISSANRRQVMRRPAAPQISAADMAAVKRAADDDVTVLGEQLQELDLELAGRQLDEATRQDYSRALDAYDAAKQSVEAVQVPQDVRHVTEILEDGRYAIACVRARVSGEPLPQRRPPCFFDPQHGPSVRDVTWSPDGGRTREVPACALDAERVAAGADPDTRKVMVGAQRVPYWQAGPAFAPWTMGYFGTFGMMDMLFMGTMMGGMFGGFGGFDGGYDQGYDQGYDAGQDAGGDSGDGGGGGYDGGGDGGGYDASGGYDGGGFDGGGFNGGGYDGGGFDGGGFDGGGFNGGGYDGGGFDGGGFDGGGF